MSAKLYRETSWFQPFYQPRGEVSAKRGKICHDLPEKHAVLLFTFSPNSCFTCAQQVYMELQLCCVGWLSAAVRRSVDGIKWFSGMKLSLRSVCYRDTTH